MTIEKIQPASLFKRNVGGHVLYSHVVVASGEKLVFISGQLARDQNGDIVGPGGLGKAVAEELATGTASIALAWIDLTWLLYTENVSEPTPSIGHPTRLLGRRC